MKGKLRKVVTQKNVYEGDKIIVAAGYASRKLLVLWELMFQCQMI